MATLPDVPVAPIRLAIDDDVVFFTTPSPVIVWNWRTDAMAAGVISGAFYFFILIYYLDLTRNLPS